MPYGLEFDAGGQETSDVITATGVLQKVFFGRGFHSRQTILTVGNGQTCKVLSIDSMKHCLK